MKYLIRDGIDVHRIDDKQLERLLIDVINHNYLPLSNYVVETIGAVNFDLTHLDKKMAQALLSYLKESKC